MKRLILIFSAWLLLLPIVAPAQADAIENPWDLLLNEMTFKNVYSVKQGLYVPKARFAKELQAIEGEEITLKGFFLPVDVTGSVFVISYNPMKTCFFCNGAGIETILELNATEKHVSKFNRLKTDNFIEVKGVLELNPDDYTRLVYILNEAELVKVHR